MRYNGLGQIARNDHGAAVCGWLDDGTVGPYQRETSADVWQMVTRGAGGITPLSGVIGGCNGVASGGGEWMRRLDVADPPLTGSQPWAPSTGRVGDIDGATAIVFDDELVVMSVYQNGVYLRDVQRTTPFGGVRLKGTIAAWVEFPGPHVVAHDVVTDTAVFVQTLGPCQYTPVVFQHGSGTWLLYQTDALGGLLHRHDDDSQGYRFGTPQSIYDPDVWLSDAGCRIGWSIGEGQFDQGELAVPVLGAGMVSLPS